jgi:acyl-coenzyme A synthetase/AMP-(fatty) acid ligase
VIAAYVLEQLSPLARLREIAFCAEFPKTRSGKIQRARLREQHESEALPNSAPTYLIDAPTDIQRPNGESTSSDK